MKSDHLLIHTFFHIITITILLFLWNCNHSTEGNTKNTSKERSGKEYTVAAYYWPSLHDEPRSRKVFWEEGIGEWQIIKQTEPRFKGHYQPRVPLWGYEMGDIPEAMEKKIDAAADHGVDAFIFDWYWFDGKPFLEETVNKGFLQADNNDRIKFYLMWANHDAKGVWNHEKYDLDSVIWKGTVDWNNFKIIVDRVISKYFNYPSYLKFNGKPVFSIYHLENFISSFAAYLQKAKDFLDNHPDDPKLITINAWNEWVEGSYLEPDMRWGYGYLEAVKKIMSGKYDH